LQANVEEEHSKWRPSVPAGATRTFQEDSEDSPEENEDAFQQQEKFLLMDPTEKDEEDSRVEDSGLGSASERTNFSEDRDSPGLSVIERARRLQGRIDQVCFNDKNVSLGGGFILERQKNTVPKYDD